MKLSEFIKKLQSIYATKPDAEFTLEAVTRGYALFLSRVDSVKEVHSSTDIHILLEGQE